VKESTLFKIVLVCLLATCFLALVSVMKSQEKPAATNPPAERSAGKAPVTGDPGASASNSTPASAELLAAYDEMLALAKIIDEIEAQSGLKPLRARFTQRRAEFGKLLPKGERLDRAKQITVPVPVAPSPGAAPVAPAAAK